MISGTNDPSKEVKVRLMRKSGQYFWLSKKLEKWFPKSAIFHRCSIQSIDNRIRYPFDAIDIKGICPKIKTYYVLRRRATLLSQSENEKVFILWVTILLFAQKQMIGSCV